MEFKILTRLDNQFGIANIKASLLVTTKAVLVATAFDLVKKVQNIEKSIAFDFVSLLTIGIFVILTFFALKVVFSFLKSGNVQSEYRSFIYFGSIKEMKKEEFVNAFKASSADELRDDALQQIYLLSSVLY